MHKDKKITLLPLSPADIRKHNKELAENAKNIPTSDDPTDVHHNGIKLKGGTFIATTSAAAELCDNPDARCYTILCRDMCVISNDPMSCTLHPAVPNLLQEFDDGMESRMTPIQEEEDDEDITTLDMHELALSPSYKLSPTWTASSVRIQSTTLHQNGDISLIRRPNKAFLDALET
jgi:hypothetical protein